MSTNSIQRLETNDPRMSQIVIRKDIVYMSGQVDKTSADVESQTRNILSKIDGYLAAAGTDKSKLLSAQIWVKDMARDFAKMNEVWCAWIDPENKPVRATVQADLALPELLVEIQVTAALD